VVTNLKGNHLQAVCFALIPHSCPGIGLKKVESLDLAGFIWGKTGGRCVGCLPKSDSQERAVVYVRQGGTEGKEGVVIMKKGTKEMDGG
jgi:hypothetical protein